MHPLAGQGVNLGFGDVACLIELIGEAVYSGSTLGKELEKTNLSFDPNYVLFWFVR